MGLRFEYRGISMHQPKFERVILVSALSGTTAITHMIYSWVITNLEFILHTTDARDCRHDKRIE
jgi:hypothetical protein